MYQSNKISFNDRLFFSPLLCKKILGNVSLKPRFVLNPLSSYYALALLECLYLNGIYMICIITLIKAAHVV